MAMDRETIEALEIVSNRRSQSMDCSLLGVLDKVGNKGDNKDA
jgi:DNA mismatch repair ATPase MutS